MLSWKIEIYRHFRGTKNGERHCAFNHILVLEDIAPFKKGHYSKVFP